MFTAYPKKQPRWVYEESEMKENLEVVIMKIGWYEFSVGDGRPKLKP